MTGAGDKPFEAGFRNSDRWTPTAEPVRVLVDVDGTPCPGIIAGRNGPRVQVRVQLDGETYLRWFDTGQVKELPDGAAPH